jgi:hypothetical protein
MGYEMTTIGEYAKLAVGTAATLTTFLFDTHEETKHPHGNKEVA